MDLNLIGKIAQTHGLKGEVKVKSDSDFIEERFEVGAYVYIEHKNEYSKLEVKSHRSMNGYELISFKGYETIDDVQRLVGKDLYAEKDRSLLDEGGHFYSEYIGMNVSQFGVIKGVVKEIVEYPQADYLVITMNNGKEKLVPLLDNFIDDVTDDTMYITDMEGLLDD